MASLRGAGLPQDITMTFWEMAPLANGLVKQAAQIKFERTNPAFDAGILWEVKRKLEEKCKWGQKKTTTFKDVDVEMHLDAEGPGDRWTGKLTILKNKGKREEKKKEKTPSFTDSECEISEDSEYVREDKMIEFIDECISKLKSWEKMDAHKPESDKAIDPEYYNKME